MTRRISVSRVDIADARFLALVYDRCALSLLEAVIHGSDSNPYPWGSPGERGPSQTPGSHADFGISRAVSADCAQEIPGHKASAVGAQKPPRHIPRGRQLRDGAG